MNSEDSARKKLESRIYWDIVSRRPDSPVKVILKMLRDHRYALSVMRKHLPRARSSPLETTDRLVLERQIFPYYLSRLGVSDVLFVGCDSDTARYEKDYFDKTRYVTIEPNPQHARFGAVHHVATTLQNLGSHFAPDHFDLIVCNGVFGWGLDRLDDCERAFEQCHACLKPQGHLLLGWNDVEPRVPVPLERISSLSRFRKFKCPLFGTWRYTTDTAYRHIFDFYAK